MISQSFIRDLIDRADIFEVVNRRVPLTVKGKTGWACCPFHNEKTPSFSVDREKGFYHCFGCGAHGTAIGFIMQYENLQYPDAVEKLAAECGVTVKYEEGTKRTDPTKPRLVDLMKRACEFYQLKFKSNKQAQEYVRQRGLTEETVEKFGIGFAPDAWHNLKAVFEEKDFTSLIEVGLMRKSEKSDNIYDFFRNRLMFPIRNQKGQVIAFSARTMIGEEPKYINTGETPIFIKGNEIFGLYEARQAISRKKRAIVVEGQMDVIQLSQAGFQEACAPLGTAIRTEHVQKLLKITDHIIFSFDGDAAGRKAARRALEISLPVLEDNQKASFLFLPEGEDPDSFVKKFGAETFEEKLARAIPLSNYMIQSLTEGLDLNVLEERNSLVEKASPLIHQVKGQLLRNGLIERLATVAKFGSAEQLANHYGFKIRPAKPYSQKYGFGSNKYGKPYSRAKATSDRSMSMSSDSPAVAILRNFLRYPQLASEYEGAADQYLSLEPSEAAKLALRVSRTVTHEDEDGHSLVEDLQTLSTSTAPDFESRMEQARSQLAALLLEEGWNEVIDREIKRGIQLATPMEVARLETERIFMQFEFDQVEAEKKELASRGIHDPDQKVQFQNLLGQSAKLRSAIREIDKTMADYVFSVNYAKKENPRG